MKHELSEMQYEQLAMEQLTILLKAIPFVDNIEIIETGLQRGFGDFWITVHFNGDLEPITICVDVKSRGELRFAQLFAIMAQQYADSRGYLFAAPYISEQTAQYLRSKKLCYMDFSGNCYIAVFPLYISVAGKPNLFKEHEYDRNYFSRSSSAASAILRTMLQEYEKVWQVKELSNCSGCSLGSVSNVKRYLVSHGWAEEKPLGFQVCNIEELLRTWAKAYHEKKDRVIKCYSLDTLPVFEYNLQRWNQSHDHPAVLAVFSAAARYAPAVRYSKASLYVDSQEVQTFVQDMELKEVSSGENVTIIIPHDRTPCLYRQIRNGDLVTSPVQTVIDLLSGIGRGEEAAEAILEKEFTKING